MIRRRGKAQTASKQQLRTVGSSATPKGSMEVSGSKTMSTPHLAEMSSHVQALQKKLEPMLARVEQATKNAEMARKTHDMANSYVGGKPHLKTLLSEQGGKLGQIARMGGKLIHFYQEDLTNLLLEDILTETAIDMQQIAEQERDKQVVDKTQEMAQDLMATLLDFENEAAAIATRWNADKQKPKTV